MLNIGPQELILILIVALVVVGPQRLPELGRSIGKALREFRKIQDDVKDTIKFDMNDDPEPYVRPTTNRGASSAGGNGAPVPDAAAPTEGATSPTAAPDGEIDPEPRAME